MNDVYYSIMEVPLAVRAGVVMFVIWLVYVVFSSLLLKLVVFVPALVNWLWLIVYRILNTVSHILHHNLGKTFANFDQTITDFCGGVYGFFDSVKVHVLNCGRRRIPGRDEYVPKRPFVGATFLILALLTAWISLPTLIHTERERTAINVAYHRYAEIEDKVLGMVFLNN